MTEESPYSIKYPRRVFIRRTLTGLGRVALRLLTRTTFTGVENIPRRGPLIVVGNHVDMFEVALMVMAVPHVIEMIAAGDVPMMTPMDPVVNAYGYIPINRGNMDRNAMTMALDVLNQNGVIGIFPEGGIWDTGIKQVHTGVAWLSSKANAPILPMGFGGMVGAIGAIAALKRPRLIVNVGQVIPPIVVDQPGVKRREVLAGESTKVMEQIEALVPVEEKHRLAEKKREYYTLQVDIKTKSGEDVDIPVACAIQHEAALARVLSLEVLLQTLYRNLRLPVHALKEINRHSPGAVADAADIVLNYLDESNPNYFNYRFGYDVGRQMREGIAQLRDLARWADENGYLLRVKATRHYYDNDPSVMAVE